MTAFATALRSLLVNKDLGASAVYRAGGIDPGVTVRVVLSRPVTVQDFGQVSQVVPELSADILAADVASVAKGDTITFADHGAFKVVNVTRDPLQLIHRMELQKV